MKALLNVIKFLSTTQLQQHQHQLTELLIQRIIIIHSRPPRILNNSFEQIHIPSIISKYMIDFSKLIMLGWYRMQIQNYYWLLLRKKQKRWNRKLRNQNILVHNTVN